MVGTQRSSVTWVPFSNVSVTFSWKVQYRVASCACTQYAELSSKQQSFASPCKQSM